MREGAGVVQALAAVGKANRPPAAPDRPSPLRHIRSNYGLVLAALVTSPRERRATVDSRLLTPRAECALIVGTGINAC